MRKIFIWPFLIIFLASSLGFWAAYRKTKQKFEYTLPKKGFQPAYEVHNKNLNMPHRCSFLGKRQIKEKTRNIYDVKYMLGEPKKVLSEKTVTTYDRKGNEIGGASISIVTEKVADVFSSMKSLLTDKYDISGELLDPLDVKEGDTDIDAYKYKYDEDNHEISKITYNDEGKLVSKEIYQYDERGNMVEESFKGGNLKREFKYWYKYDENGNKIEERYYSDYGKGLHEGWRTKYEYDDKSNLIEEARYLPSGEMDQQLSYKYDDKGNRIAGIFKRRESVTETAYAYDGRSNLCSKLVIEEKKGETVDWWGEFYTHRHNWRGEIKEVKTYEVTRKLLEVIADRITMKSLGKIREYLQEENLKEITTYKYKYYPKWFFFF